MDHVGSPRTSRINLKNARIESPTPPQKLRHLMAFGAFALGSPIESQSLLCFLGRPFQLRFHSQTQSNETPSLCHPYRPLPQEKYTNDISEKSSFAFSLAFKSRNISAFPFLLESLHPPILILNNTYSANLG